MQSTRKCSIEHCQKPKRARGWCKGHYDRWLRNGDGFDTGPLLDGSRGCSIEGCGGKHAARGWCKPHYGVWRNHGDPLHVNVPKADLVDWSADKKCADCHETKPLAEFYKTVVGTPMRRCKKCHYAITYSREPEQMADRRMQTARARAKNRELAYARSAEWRRNNPERERRWQSRPRFIKAEDLESKLAYWGGKCWMCPAPFEHWDHVKPISKNGPNVLANLRPACARCNISKSASWHGVHNLHYFLKGKDHV